MTRSFRLSCTVGLRVFVCENLAFHGEYTPVLAKHSKHFSLEDSLAIGVDRMQRNFGPLKQQVDEWRAMQLSTAAAKLLIYQAFIEEESGFPKHLARRVHDLYFQPVHEEFQPRTMWSLSNAFTSAFKELEPIPAVQGDGEAGGLSAIGPSFVIPTRNVDVRFRLTPSIPSLGLRGRRWNRASHVTGRRHVNATLGEFHETPSE